MVGFFIVRRQMIERINYSILIAAKPRHHINRVVKSHQGHFVLRPEPRKRFESCVMNLFAERVKAAASVYQQDDRERERVLT